MAQDLSAISVFPHFKNFTASTTLTEIKIPGIARTITIGSDAAAIYVCTVGGATAAQYLPTGHLCPSPTISVSRQDQGMLMPIAQST